jgi:phage-related tail protein
MNEATKKWSDYIINGTFADEVATQIGTSVVDPETGVKQTDPAGVAQAAINASQAVADWAEKFEPVLEALEAAIEKVGTSIEDMLLDTEAEEKALDDFFNQIVGAGGTNEILSTLDGTMLEVEASQREMAEKSASIDETIKKIDEDIEAWDEQLDLIGLSTSEIEETRKQVEEFKAATLDELGKNGKYYAEIAATLKDLAAKWEQYNISDRNLRAQEDAEKGYSSGGVANFRGRAMLHGSTSRPEVVLNNSQAAALFNWVNGLSSGRYDAMFDSFGQEINLLERQLHLLNAKATPTSTSHGDTYNFGTVNIDSDADSIEQLVTDIRRLSPLTQRR